LHIPEPWNKILPGSFNNLSVLGQSDISCFADRSDTFAREDDGHIVPRRAVLHINDRSAFKDDPSLGRYLRFRI
jgi:hypothetical protein